MIYVEQIDGLSIICANGTPNPQRFFFGDTTRIVRQLTGAYLLPVTAFGIQNVLNTLLGSPILFKAMNIHSTNSISGVPDELPSIEMTRATIDGKVISEKIPVNSLLRNTQFQKGFVTARNDCGYWKIDGQRGLDIVVPSRVLVTIVLYDFLPSYYCF